MDLLQAPAFLGAVDALADELRRDRAEVRTDAARYVRELAASHNARATGAWQKFGDWVMRAHDLLVDEDETPGCGPWTATTPWGWCSRTGPTWTG